MPERSLDWLRQAEVRHAHHARDDGDYNWSAFAAHQAAEQALKAVFQPLGAEAWGHSVADLLTELARLHPISEPLRDAALELDKAYIPTRYPNAHPSGAPRARCTRTEATRLIEHAKTINEFCSRLLSTP